MNNHPPNNPLYNPLGNATNIHLLDSMFGMPGPDQSVHKPTLIPAQYAYQDMQTLSHPHHAMNLAQSHVVTTAASSVPINEISVTPQVLIYQGSVDQQQPISYKIPQMETSSVASVAVTIPTAPIMSHQALEAQVVRTTGMPASHVTAMLSISGERRKDIVAEAASKIFEDIGGKKLVSAEQLTTSIAITLPTAVKSEPTPSSMLLGVNTGNSSAGAMVKSETAGTNSSATPSTSSGLKTPVPARPSVGRARGASSRPLHRQQIMPPRLQLLDDEDDGVTCRMCLQSFWYKAQLHEHLKANHSVTDPERYEREEREKKLRRRREEQQRQIMAKRQRMAAAQGRMSRGGSRMGKVSIPGPRPSFQYREGAFICDLCKKSFSDGNDMVSHWKLHVKKQRQLDAAKAATEEATVRRGRGKTGKAGDDYSPPRRGRGRGGRGLSHTSSRGRPISGASAGRGKKRGKGRRDKGKPRWTAYLVWSTRRRKEISIDRPGLGFAEVAKTISEEWKKVTDEERGKLQDEADKMNASGQRKLPKSRENTSDDTDSDSDPSFDEDNIKPIMLKIKKEGGEEKRSTRKRKRPSFFQEFENEENNLDKILDEFEQEQIEESKKPRADKPTRTPRAGGAPRRRRKRTPSPDEANEPVELERSRSGRMRKKPKFKAYFKGDEGDEEEEDTFEEEDEEDRDEYQPNESDEVEDDQEDESVGEDEEEEDDQAELDEDGNPKKKRIALPPKKRGTKKIMTDAEIEEATQAAMSAKSIFNDDDDDFDGDEGEDGSSTKDSENYKVKPTWVESDEGEGVKVKREPDEEKGEVAKAPNNPGPSASDCPSHVEESQPVDASGMVSEVTEETPLGTEILSQDGGDLNAGSSSTNLPDVPVQMEVDEDDDDNPQEPQLAEPPKDAPVVEESVTEPVEAESQETPAIASDPVPLAPQFEEPIPPPPVPEAVEALAHNGSSMVEALVAPQEESSLADTLLGPVEEVGDPMTSIETPVGVVASSEEDLLNTAVPSKMEEGDDKYKDIIAEGQLDNIFN